MPTPLLPLAISLTDLAQALQWLLNRDDDPNDPLPPVTDEESLVLAYILVSKIHENHQIASKVN